MLLANHLRCRQIALTIALLSAIPLRYAAADLIVDRVFKQQEPDGRVIEVKVTGDEFYHLVESLDGYTLTQDPVSRYTCYAQLSLDGERLISTGVRVAEGVAAPANIKPGLRVTKASAMRQATEAREAFYTAGGIGANVDDIPQAANPSVGNVFGLCLIVDFDDDVGTIPASTVSDMCNKPGYGAQGSARDYFLDVSDGALDYTNYVPPTYYRAIKLKTYYNDTSVSFGPRARELVLEALNNLKDQGHDFSQYDSNNDGRIDGINVFYAGARPGTWATGLWPHSWTVSFSASGVSSYKYQMTNMGTNLPVSTFCHENGHMLCGFPDLYDYDHDSNGVGRFCIMCAGGLVEPCAWLKDKAGWANIITLDQAMSGLPAIAGLNTIYRFPHPTLTREFYMVENRHRSGRDSTLPESGLAIWHIDTSGSNDNQEMTPASHYKVTLVQADGDWDFEHDRNNGDGQDLYRKGYREECGPETLPATTWWDGSQSGLLISNISASGQTMTFDYGATRNYGETTFHETWENAADLALPVDAVGAFDADFHWDYDVGANGGEIILDATTEFRGSKAIALTTNGLSGPDVIAELRATAPPTRTGDMQTITFSYDFAIVKTTTGDSWSEVAFDAGANAGLRISHDVKTGQPLISMQVGTATPIDIGLSTSAVDQGHFYRLRVTYYSDGPDAVLSYRLESRDTFSLVKEGVLAFAGAALSAETSLTELAIRFDRRAQIAFDNIQVRRRPMITDLIDEDFEAYSANTTITQSTPLPHPTGGWVWEKRQGADTSVTRARVSASAIAAGETLSLTLLDTNSLDQPSAGIRVIESTALADYDEGAGVAKAFYGFAMRATAGLSPGTAIRFRAGDGDESPDLFAFMIGPGQTLMMTDGAAAIPVTQLFTNRDYFLIGGFDRDGGYYEASLFDITNPAAGVLLHYSDHLPLNTVDSLRSFELHTPPQGTATLVVDHISISVDGPSRESLSVASTDVTVGNGALYPGRPLAIQEITLTGPASGEVALDGLNVSVTGGAPGDAVEAFLYDNSPGTGLTRTAIPIASGAVISETARVRFAGAQWLAKGAQSDLILALRFANSAAGKTFTVSFDEPDWRVNPLSGARDGVTHSSGAPVAAQITIQRIPPGSVNSATAKATNQVIVPGDSTTENPRRVSDGLRWGAYNQASGANGAAISARTGGINIYGYNSAENAQYAANYNGSYIYTIFDDGGRAWPNHRVRLREIAFTRGNSAAGQEIRFLIRDGADHWFLSQTIVPATSGNSRAVDLLNADGWWRVNASAEREMNELDTDAEVAIDDPATLAVETPDLNSVTGGGLYIETGDTNPTAAEKFRLQTLSWIGEVESAGSLQVADANGLTMDIWQGGLGFFDDTRVGIGIDNPTFDSVVWQTTTVSWLDVDLPGGALLPGESTTPVLSLNGNTLLLAPGWHDATVTFSDHTNATSIARSVATLVRPRAPLTLNESFEIPSLAQWWRITGDTGGAPRITGDLSPRTGSAHFMMDASGSGPAFNNLTFCVNIAQTPQATLRFWVKSFDDEADAPPGSVISGATPFDGVSISAGGQTWHAITLFDLPSGVYTPFEVDLVGKARQRGLDVSNGLLVRFSQFGSKPAGVGPGSWDGIAIDDITIGGATPPRRRWLMMY